MELISICYTTIQVASRISSLLSHEYGDGTQIVLQIKRSMNYHKLPCHHSPQSYTPFPIPLELLISMLHALNDPQVVLDRLSSNVH